MEKIKKLFIEKNFLCTLFYIFVILWCSVGAFCSLRTVFLKNVKAVIIILILLMLYVFIAKYIINKLNTNKKYVNYIAIALIIGLGLLLRIASNAILRTIPISDFNAPHSVYQLKDKGIFNPIDSPSEQSIYQMYYSVFPAWFPYMKVVSVIYDIFGLNIFYIKIMNWMLYIVSSLLIYNIFKDKSKKNGLFAMILFSCLPSLIIYSSITTPDHISIFLFLLYIWTWKKLLKAREEEIKKSLIGYSVLNIITMCLINLFKPLLILGVLVFICFEIIYFFPKILDKSTRKKYFQKNLLYVIIFVIVSFGALRLESIILNKNVENTINTKVVDSTGLYMLWGYSIDEFGIYNSEPATKIYTKLLEQYDKDVSKAMEKINVLAKKQLKNNFKYLPTIILQKFNLVYHSERDIFEWAKYSDNVEYSKKITNKYVNKYEYVANSYMSILLIMTAVSLFNECKKKDKDKLMVVLALIITGYTCILVFGGVQPRYKTLMFGPFCLLAASSIVFKKKVEEKC